MSNIFAKAYSITNTHSGRVITVTRNEGSDRISIKDRHPGLDETASMLINSEDAVALVAALQMTLEDK